MKATELSLPEFLLAEFPVKTGQPDDERHFIVHRGITLIEVLPLAIMTELLNDNVVKKQYTYTNPEGLTEKFILTYHTNNGHFHGFDQFELLDKAWKFYENYLRWEDENIDTGMKGKLN